MTKGTHAIYGQQQESHQKGQWRKHTQWQKRERIYAENLTNRFIDQAQITTMESRTHPCKKESFYGIGIGNFPEKKIFQKMIIKNMRKE